MKTIVTGSKGFIGQHLVQRLRKEGIETYTLDHKTLSDPIHIKNTFDKIKPDYVFHLASYGNMSSQQVEAEMIQANYINLFNILVSLNAPLFNFSSSSTLLEYETFYSATKGAGERLCKAFVNKYDKQIVNIQPYTVIGVGEQPQHLIPTLIRSCLYGEKMNFIGEPVHDFIGVNDFIDALIIVVENYQDLIGKNIQIGSGIKRTNEEILNKVETLSEKKANIKRVGTMRPYDNEEWQADVRLINRLGFRQKESIQETIKEMINYELGI